MKKFFLLIIFTLVFCMPDLFAQKTKKTPSGLGFEAGMGYNFMNLTVKKNSGEDTLNHYNRFWIQPSFRVHYDVSLKNFGTSNSLKLKTFIGYYTFGGKIKLNDIGEFDILSFASIEAGLGLSVDIKNMFQISPLFKAQYVVASTKRFIREISKQPVDIKSSINPFCYDAGLQFRFKYKHFTVGAEGWLGLVDFYKSGEETAKEVSFRLMLGYEF